MRSHIHRQAGLGSHLLIILSTQSCNFPVLGRALRISALFWPRQPQLCPAIVCPHSHRRRRSFPARISSAFSVPAKSVRAAGRSTRKHAGPIQRLGLDRGDTESVLRPAGPTPSTLGPGAYNVLGSPPAQSRLFPGVAFKRRAVDSLAATAAEAAAPAPSPPPGCSRATSAA